jgi:C4-type Zn-finger protein
MAVVSASLVVLSLQAAADEESDRNYIIREIEGYLGDMRGYLDGVSGDSSSSDIDSAIDRADRVKSKISDLDRVKVSDSKAAEMVSRYPGYVDKFKESARYLKQMKDQQRSLDELPRRCEDKGKELSEKIRKYTDANDPKGIEDLPKLGREYGRPIVEAIDKADRQKSELEGWKDRAKYFSESDGRWSDVKSELRDAADEVYDYWKRRWEDSKKLCNDLTKEERNPLVEQGLRLLADGEKIRQELYKELDSRLDEAARLLDDLHGDSSDSDVESAIRKADELASLLDKLRNAKGDDRTANEMANNWPRFISAYRESTKTMKDLKQGQFLVDKGPQFCKDSEDKLRETIRGYVDRKDPKGIKELPLKAKYVGVSIQDKLQKADEHLGKMRSLKDAVRGFTISDGKWRYVSENLRDSAQSVYDYLEKAVQESHRACDELAKGESHREVVAAIKTLGEQASSAIDVFKRDAETWSQEAQSLFRLDCASMEQIWEAFCGADEEKNESPDRDTARARAKEIASPMISKVDGALRQYEDLKKRGSDLAAEEETRARAEQVLAKMKEIGDKFARIKERGSLKGADHPISQFSIEYGKQQHDSMASSFSCDVYDKPFDGADGRPDCVKASKCMVYEFKPKNDKAVSKGKAQLDRYVGAVAKYYQERIRRGEAADSDRGGSAIIDVIKKNCMDGDDVEFDGKVETYNMCEKKYECEQ